jgi:DNA-binding IclR family transcriptional regulator
MPMKVSISRSVGRAFAVMEIFRETRQPANATQLSRRLDAPHSSVVAVLHNLRDLGYLRFDQTDMTYFPTEKLLDLTGWLRPAPRDHGRLGVLVERVARESGHITVLSSRMSLFVNTVMLRPGKFSTVSPPSRAVGAALTASVAGLVILAQMAAPEMREVLRETEAWLRDAGARKNFDTGATLARIEAVRGRGFLAGAHPTCRATEIFACGVTGAQGAPFALSLHIPACLSRDSKAALRHLLETRVRESEASLGRTTVPAAVITAAPRPAARAQNFGACFAQAVRDSAPRPRMLATGLDAG